MAPRNPQASGEGPELVLGPLLRYAGTESATVWVEIDRPAEVEVLGSRSHSFHVEGHHYALVLIDDLTPDSITPYEVALDGRSVWPPGDGRPASAIHTRRGERHSQLAFGSCRVGAPQRAPYTLPPAEDPEGVGIDALWAYSRALQNGSKPWPDGLLLLGDQVYADEVSPATLDFIKSRRSVEDPPGEGVADFEEYTRLYRESWSDPDIRWLLSTVPSTMIFDDHEVSDDWNISAAWLDEIRREPWWNDRVIGAFMSYWIYQHLGNLSPPEFAEDSLFPLVQSDDDAGPRLRAEAFKWDRESAASRWAYYRDFGRSRLLVIDSRAARVLADGRRDMIDEDEWRWIEEHARGSFDHLIVASTLPVFMGHGVHYLEAWSEAICDGAWGRGAAKLGERLRRAVDLEHWPAFHDSFERLVALLREVSRGNGNEAPSTILLLGGDVHTAYVGEVSLGGNAGSSAVFQIVCSPFRNPLTPAQRRVIRWTNSRPATAIFRLLARAVKVQRTAATWTFLGEPTFENSIGELELDGRAARMTISRTTAGSGDGPLLRELFGHRLAEGTEGHER
ncbi:MAG TPA: alkaline phosphatase D family protein [Gaiellaceae bacterium]